MSPGQVDLITLLYIRLIRLLSLEWVQTICHNYDNGTNDEQFKVISLRGLSLLIIVVNYCVLMHAVPAVLILLAFDKL